MFFNDFDVLTKQIKKKNHEKKYLDTFQLNYIEKEWENYKPLQPIQNSKLVLQ